MPRSGKCRDRKMNEIVTANKSRVVTAHGISNNNVVEDEGGMYGHIKFLRAINEDENEDNGQYEDKEGSLAWAKDLGWSRRKKQL